MNWSDKLEPNTPVYKIAASEERYIRVIAGPGTGKSFAMKRRVARLLEIGVVPSKILPVTFTRVAAEDLHRELVQMKVLGCEQIEGTTLHSLALRILMRNYVLLATGRTPRPLNDFEIKPLEIDLAAKHGGVRKIRKKIKAYESAWARLQHDEPGYAPSSDDKNFEEDLKEWLQFHSAMLIGEVIPQLHSYLSSNPVTEELSEFSHILVDEYQDLNKAEQGVITLLSQKAEVCIVGDDDQSIYSFKHAHPEGIRNWTKQHPNANDLTLDVCRRCPTRVVEMANKLIDKNISRPEARRLTALQENGEGDVRIIQYKTLESEVTGILKIISELLTQGVPPGEILVLAQRDVIGTPIYERLVSSNIPARSYYAESELDVEETQRKFALLKLYVNREDKVALRWLLGLVHKQWHAKEYAKLRHYCEQIGGTPWDILKQLENGTINISSTDKLVSKFSLIKAAIDDLHNLIDLEAVINQLFPEEDPSVRDIRNLAMKTLQESGIQDKSVFLQKLTAAIAKPDIPSEIQEVRVMSLHKSKGLSSAVTIIAGCVEGLLPRQPDMSLPQALQNSQIEEQRRLFYVGITRVKAVPSQNKPGTLILTYSQSMPTADALKAGISPAGRRFRDARLNASRFIKEMAPAAPMPIIG